MENARNERFGCINQSNGGNIQIDSTQRASLGNDDANQAGSFCTCLSLPGRIDAQRKLLVSQGFIVDDAATRALKDCGYYRLSLYWAQAEASPSVAEAIPFELILRIYSLDEKLREWLWRAISPIEIKFRSRYAEMLASAAGPLAYRRAELFKDPAAFEKSLSIIDKEIHRASKSNGMYARRGSACENVMPIWGVAEIATWGTMSKLYGNTQMAALRSVSNGQIGDEVAISFGVKTFLLKSWIYQLTMIRNICAHQNKLYGHVFKVKAKLLIADKPWSSRLAFPTFVIIKRIYERSWPEAWPQMAADLRATIAAYPGVDLKPLGFPDTWQEVLA